MQRQFRVTGLTPGQSFNWNGRSYRQFDLLTVDEDTPPEALRHLLHYNDCLVNRKVVTETTETQPQAETVPPAPAEEE